MALLSHAFRPFFLLAAASAIAGVGMWMLALNGQITFPTGVDPVSWHAHEMIVGFAMAAIAGFILTAVAAWTGRPAVRDLPLLWLVVSWLLGRVAMLNAAGMNVTATAALDMLFPASLCYLATREIFAARNRRNYKIVAIIGVLAAANLAYHLIDARSSLYVLIHTVLLLVALIGGRIVPNFTANWLRGQGVVDLPANNVTIDRFAIAMTILVGVASVFFPDRMWAATLAFLAAGVHLVRVMQWRGLQTVRNPLLLILHVAYWWLPVGYFMTGLAGLGLIFAPTTALHVLTMGAIGSTVFAMITRVPLGHTGRPLHASRLTVAAYVLLTVAVCVRVASPSADGMYLALVNGSAAGWCLAFAVFLWVYWPVMTRPRKAAQR